MFVALFDKGKLKKNNPMGGERENSICPGVSKGGGASRAITMELIL